MGGGCFYNGHPKAKRLYLRYAQPRIPVYVSRAKDIKDAFKVCPNPDPCFLAYRNSSYHKSSPDSMEGYWITHKHWMLLTPSQGESIVAVSSMEAEYIACYFGIQDIENGFANYSRI
jgi:hypothetical protein